MVEAEPLKQNCQREDLLRHAEQIVQNVNPETIDRILAYKYLHSFIRQAWRVVDPSPFQDGWHIETICEYLEAIHSGQIRKLIINMPPRHMKSLACSVFFPAWKWLHDPGTRFLSSSYAHSLSIRDSVKCRRLIQSPFYKGLMNHYHKEFLMTGDVNNKIRFENNFGGVRLASSVEGALTGEGGDIIIVDDPHNVVEGESAVKRKAVLDWWDQAMSTRLNNPKTGAYIIIMQRVHENDLTGHILSKENDFEHLKLPARYEGKKRISVILPNEDLREEIDEPLWPEVYGDKELKNLEESLGSYGSAGQLQQRPAPREGGMFKVTHLLQNLINDVPPSLISRSVRYWDKAGTAGAGCFSAGVLLHELKDGTIVVGDVVKGQWSALQREERIKATANLDGRRVKIWIEQEPGSGGKESAESTIRALAGYVVKADRVTGDKVSRAEPFAAQVEAGNVFVLKREWTEEYIEELELFPNSKYKDMTDASAGAFNHLFHKRITPHVGSSVNSNEKEKMAEELKKINIREKFADILAQASTEEERIAIEKQIYAELEKN